MSESDVRRQATAAGVFLKLDVPLSSAGGGSVTVAPDDKEADELLVWLDRWQGRRRRTVGRPDENEQHEVAWLELVKVEDRIGYMSAEWVWMRAAPDDPSAWPLPVVTPLLDPPAGFELVRKSWCPRCDRIGGDPLGWWHDFGGKPGDRMKGYLRRPRCAVFPPAPLLEIGLECRGRSGSGWRPGLRFDGPWRQLKIWRHVARVGWKLAACGARRLYRWGLRRALPMLSQSTVYVDGSANEFNSVSVSSAVWSLLNGDFPPELPPSDA